MREHGVPADVARLHSAPRVQPSLWDALPLAAREAASISRAVIMDDMQKKGGVMEVTKLMNEHWQLRDFCRAALEKDLTNPKGNTTYVWYDFEG